MCVWRCEEFCIDFLFILQYMSHLLPKNLAGLKNSVLHPLCQKRGVCSWLLPSPTYSGQAISTGTPRSSQRGFGSDESLLPSRPVLWLLAAAPPSPPLPMLERERDTCRNPAAGVPCTEAALRRMSREREKERESQLPHPWHGWAFTRDQIADLLQPGSAIRTNFIVKTFQCFILTRAGFLHSVRGDEKAQLLQADTIRTAVKLFHLLLVSDSCRL